jgi:mannan endo-1,6-alpha-mannosidase
LTVIHQTYSQSWVTRTTGVLEYINQTFFSNNIVFEPSCSLIDCTPGQRTFRALLVKFMAKSAMAAPYITTPIQWTLQQNGRAIANMCSNPVAGNSTCTINGQTGIGEQLTGLNSVVSLLIGRSKSDDQAPAGAGGQAPSANAGGAVATSSLSSTLFAMIIMIHLFT